MGRAPAREHESLTEITDRAIHGRSKETYLKEKDPRAQHAQEGARYRDSELPQVRGDQTAAPRLRGVRLLRRTAGSRGKGSVALGADRVGRDGGRSCAPSASRRRT